VHPWRHHCAVVEDGPLHHGPPSDHHTGQEHALPDHRTLLHDDPGAEHAALHLAGDVAAGGEEAVVHLCRAPQPGRPLDVNDARCLVMVGDSITTDHISPAGNIKKDSPAGKFLTDNGVAVKDFNSYGARRGNDRVMTRGTVGLITSAGRVLRVGVLDLPSVPAVTTGALSLRGGAPASEFAELQRGERVLGLSALPDSGQEG